MGECPACGEETELLDESEKVDRRGEKHPEWKSLCTNDDCRVGILLKESAVADSG